MRDVLSLYGDAPLSTRVFLELRAILSDLEYIEKIVPPAGTILDLGCGHGLFTNLMALRSPERRVLGIDLDPRKLEHARKTVVGRDNIDFICANLLTADIPECDAITIVDVFYLLQRQEQYRLLAECRRKLREGGRLIWKAQARRPRWKYALTYLQEFISTSAGITLFDRHSSLEFLSREEAVSALSAAGFRTEILGMKKWRPYTDIIYLGRKKDIGGV